MKKIDFIGFVVLVLLITAISVLAMPHNSGPIESALQAEAKSKELDLRASKVGLTCGIFSTDACSGLVARAEKNPKLKEVFLKAKAAGVYVFPATFISPFSIAHVGEGMIHINSWYSDEKIIAYLNGE